MTDQRGGVSPTGSSADKPEVPWAFIDCPCDTLVELIAHMLDLLCQHNDQVVLTPDALTRFHSRAPPNITVIDYLRRIVKYTNLEKIPLLSLLAYIDLTCQNLPTFTLSSLTVHRFLIAGVTAGSKAQCDVFCTNSHYAKVGGIKVNELNSLEREFLRVTGWALCCNADLLQRYYTSLIRSHGGFVQAPEPEVSPFRAFPDAGKPAPVQDSEPATPVPVAEESEYGSEEGEEQRGRGRQRDEMEVDEPAAADDDNVAAPSHPPDEAASASSSSRSIKSFVGGIFKRDSSAPSPAVVRSRPLSTASSAGVASPTVDAVNVKPLTPRVRTREERSVDSLRAAMPTGVADDGKRRARVE
ncbi:uncharacterized protein EHS24_001992 [Apiotrichum porosum]|uniref:Cyclin-domain-containing protein n=1 Tax=Apiotrichum porosum TaxID=105984 RepID=A0A427XJT7_9TREE|nr:uncharacterized protein EHS24_001992 [Apiotrichum porosum]RSH79062.1 hypothetical protein EHS24_001992 [Apiotrichum porosum]